jgi:selenophosphate synthetase-related protein
MFPGEYIRSRSRDPAVLLALSIVVNAIDILIMVGMIQELIDALSSEEEACKKSEAENAVLKTRTHATREALQELSR